MGKRIDYDQALSMAQIKSIDSIHAPQNRYGYKLNVNHPDINPLYERYKQFVGAKILSDAQRMDFEHRVFKMIEKKRPKETENADNNT